MYLPLLHENIQNDLILPLAPEEGGEELVPRFLLPLGPAASRRVNRRHEVDQLRVDVVSDLPPLARLSILLPARDPATVHYE